MADPRTDGLDEGRDGIDWVEALGFGKDYEDDPIELIEKEK